MEVMLLIVDLPIGLVTDCVFLMQAYQFWISINKMSV